MIIISHSCARLSRAPGGCFLAIGLAAGLVLEPTFAAVVVTCDETHLREAIAAGGTVTFACDGVIALSKTLHIEQNTVLDANGHAVTLSGHQTVRVLQVDNGVSFTGLGLNIVEGFSHQGGGLYNDGGIVQLSDCTWIGNRAVGTAGADGASAGNGGAGSDGQGGAVFNAGFLSVTRCLFRGNRAEGGTGGAGGSGIDGIAQYDPFGRCYFGTAGGNGGEGGAGGVGLGGAIYNTHEVQVRFTSFLDNQALGGTGGMGGQAGAGGCGAPGGNGGNAGFGGPAYGGAVYNNSSLVIEQSALADNHASGGAGGRGGESALWMSAGGKGGTGGSGYGGAIWNQGITQASNTTVAYNGAEGGAGGFGGLFNQFGCPAQAGHGGDGFGGGIVDKDQAEFDFCTLWQNTSHAGIGTNNAVSPNCPVAVFPGTNGLAGADTLWVISGESTVANCIIGNTTSSNNCQGMVIDSGYNLFSDASCPATETSSRDQIDPRLGALADSGGPTATIVLLEGSPALDAADPDACPGTDQRGMPRPVGAGCDIGAFEGEALSVPVLTLEFLPDTIKAEESATLVFNLSNPNNQVLHGLAFTDALPPGLRVAVGAPIVSDCAQAVVLAEPAAQIIQAHINLAAQQSCSVQIQIASGVPGVWVNTLLQLTSTETGPIMINAAATLEVTGPRVKTGPANEVTPDAAMLLGWVNPNGLETIYYFDYGTTTNYGIKSAKQALAGSSTLESVSLPVTSLIHNTEYHYRLVAHNDAGFVYGQDLEFKTPSGVVEVYTENATGVTTNTAVLAGSVIPSGYAATAYFEFGLTDAYGMRTPTQALGAGSATVPVSAAVNGLIPGQTYHFRIVAQNGPSMARGADQTFFTPTASGMAVDLNGNGHWFLASAGLPTAPPWTISLWFRAGATGGGWLLGATPSSFGFDDTYFQLYLNQAGQVAFGVYDGAYETIHAADSSEDGQWHHAAASISAQGMKLYVDGALAAAEPSVTTGVNFPGYWKLAYRGNMSWAGSPAAAWFKGQVDEVRIWNIARTSEEILCDMHCLLGGDELGLLTYWNFDEPQFNHALDQSGHNNRGLIQNNPYRVPSTIPRVSLPTIVLQPGGGVRVRFPAPMYLPSILQGSADLNTWTDLRTNNTAPNCLFDYEEAAPSGQKFFRVVTP